jgi:hypothetical protein
VFREDQQYPHVKSRGPVESFRVRRWFCFKLKSGSGNISREVVAAIIYDVIVMMTMLVAFLGVSARTVFRNRKHLKD